MTSACSKRSTADDRGEPHDQHELCQREAAVIEECVSQHDVQKKSNGAASLRPSHSIGLK